MAIRQNHIFENPTASNFMESRLIIKNFGPIKNVDLNLKNVNVFIGQQATGKSAIAKIFTIFKAPRKYFVIGNSENKEVKLTGGEIPIPIEYFEDALKQYNIFSFLTPQTEIEFESEIHRLVYYNGELIYNPKLYDKISNWEILSTDFATNKDSIINDLKKISTKFAGLPIKSSYILNADSGKNKLNTFDDYINLYHNITENNFVKIIEIIKHIENDLSTNAASYIPAERNFINIIKKSALNLIKNNVPIPAHILNFGAELEKATITEIDLDFIHQFLKYKKIDGEDKIFVNNSQSINLIEASSGIQSVIPIILAIRNREYTSHKSFVIEEPELNLFPTAQYELIQILEYAREDMAWEDVGAIHTYTTHSPFILSALNNLLYAYYVNLKLLAAQKDESEIVKINKIVKAIIDPTTFAAYQICEGVATSIFNKKTGLIDDNYIDEASDKINDDFDQLMELLK